VSRSHPLWNFLTSLRLTVVLLAFSILIVFLGTWAQVHEGLYGAQSRWFRSYLVWWNVFGAVPETSRYGFPLPGGYTIGFLLLANLIAAHFKRFTWGASKVGIQLTHIGVILMLVGGLATDKLQKESHMGLLEGQSKSFTEDHRANELVLLTDQDGQHDNVIAIPEDLLKPGADVAVPNLPLTVRVKEYHVNGDIFTRTALVEAVNTITRALTTVQAQFSTPEALVTVAEAAKESPGRVAIWMDALGQVGEKDAEDIVAAAKRVQPQKEKAEKLCGLLRDGFRKQMLEVMSMRRPKADRNMVFAAGQFKAGKEMDPAKWKEPATRGTGPAIVAFPLDEATDGDTRNMPLSVVEVLESGKSLGTWLITPLLDPQPVELASGQTVRLGLRFLRYYLPFSVTLVKATHEKYAGTAAESNEFMGIPKNFESRVQIINPRTNENREVDIYMNHPLSYGGLTFFQYQMSTEELSGRGVNSSTFQVVRNPASITPYLGCLIVAAGLLYQFAYHLFGFGRRSKASTPPPIRRAAAEPALPVR
jgi:hypothetical protein